MVAQDLINKRVALDTAPLIYFIEGYNQYYDSLYKIFDLNDQGAFTFITSSVTLLEVLVKPLKKGKTLLVDQYKKYFNQSAFCKGSTC